MQSSRPVPVVSQAVSTSSDQKALISELLSVKDYKFLHPPSRFHQLLRPHLWQWLEIALGGGDFAHFLSMGLVEDHSFVFQQLMLQESEEEASIPSHTRAQINMLTGDGDSRL